MAEVCFSIALRFRLRRACAAWRLPCVCPAGIATSAHLLPAIVGPLRDGGDAKLRQHSAAGDMVLDVVLLRDRNQFGDQRSNMHQWQLHVAVYKN